MLDWCMITSGMLVEPADKRVNDAQYIICSATQGHGKNKSIDRSRRYRHTTFVGSV